MPNCLKCAFYQDKKCFCPDTPVCCAYNGKIDWEKFDGFIKIVNPRNHYCSSWKDREEE